MMKKVEDDGTGGVRVPWSRYEMLCLVFLVIPNISPLKMALHLSLKVIMTSAIGMLSICLADTPAYHSYRRMQMGNREYTGV